jgi:hypothetical protein
MLIDESSLKHVDKYATFIRTAGSKNAKHYAGFSEKGTREDKINKNSRMFFVHNYLLNEKMVDHINRNPLDNRRCNLRPTTPKENNNNRGNVHKDYGCLGIRFVQKDESWQARIKQDGKEYSRSFSVKKYGYDEAKRLAITAREEFNIKFNCNNGLNEDGELIIN